MKKVTIIFDETPQKPRPTVTFVLGTEKPYDPSKPLPCPACGGKMEIHIGRTNTEWYVCENCNIESSRPLPRATALSKWNAFVLKCRG